MTANTAPVFTNVPNLGFATLTTGTNTYTGTSGTSLIFTAGTNGSVATKIICESLGTNVATVLRVFLNNGSTSGTATNNSLIYQLSLPATTASATAQTQHLELPMNNLRLKASYTLIVVLATTVSAGWQVTAVGGDY